MTSPAPTAAPGAGSASRTGDPRAALAGALVLLGLVVGLVYGATTARDLTNDDAYVASLAGWRIATTGAPWMEGLDTSRIGIVREHDATIETAANGHEVSHISPGAMAAAVPGHVLAGAGAEPEDFSLVPGALSAAVLATIGVLLFFGAVSTRLRVAHATAAAAALAFATPMWSVASNALWSHAVTVVGLAGMARAASRDRWWLVGLLGGVALWGRLHVAVVVAVVGVGVAVARRDPRIAVRVAVPSLAMLGLASVWTHWVYGLWRPTGGYGASNRMELAASGFGDSLGGLLANHAGLWVSPDRGVLLWTPVLLLLTPAVVRAWSTLPDWSRWLAVGGLCYTIGQGQIAVFHGGDGFYGYRLGLELLICVAPAVAFSAHRAGRVAGALLGPVLGAQAAAIAVGAISEGFFVYRDDAWSDNAFWLALRTLPGLWLWLALMVVLGGLGAQVWRQRGLQRPRATAAGPEPAGRGGAVPVAG